MAYVHYYLSILMEIYYFMIIGYLILSWFPNARESFIGGLLSKLVEPYLSPFRKIIPSIGFIDLSPIVALIALRFVVMGIAAVLDFIVGMF
ncbi:membrane protein [Paenibacillus marchantiophytorum]|uniref:Membrane protein n=2 Tax=Paenibacillus TaxID=44249 RepID=A0ABQ2BPW6_9BACL|nr:MULTISPECIES: YggT family protein [Paenibacillus]UKS30261.1 YggT family protein [Paenibacillus sp. HWE-109]GGI43297.1 membrane protein [Paenibacillus marchantiophytorum]